MTRKDKNNRRLCTAHRKDGEPCTQPAIKGGMVCRMHGGSAPQTKAKAARVLLEELVGPALVEFKRMLEAPETPAAVRVSIVNSILDRTGYKPVVKVEGIPTVAAVEAWLEEIEDDTA